MVNKTVSISCFLFLIQVTITWLSEERYKMEIGVQNQVQQIGQAYLTNATGLSQVSKYVYDEEYLRVYIFECRKLALLASGLVCDQFVKRAFDSNENNGIVLQHLVPYR